ncbi:MAG: glycosyltransferase [Bacteroidales bacterium]|nr:glycosyltransferase [Bacteroidales bacterium]
MKISIIIPVYNVATYIEDCMQSICQQTFKDFEVILVDDCGQDNSIALAVAVLQQHGIEPVVLHHQKNRGLSAARNTGMEVAQGEYVFFLDSDDQLTPVCLASLLPEAEKTHADMTFGAFETFGDEHRQCHTDGSLYVMAWNKLCRRQFLLDNKIQFIEGLVHEDCPWSFELECKAGKIAFVSQITYRYLIRNSGLQRGGEFTRHYYAYCTILRAYAHTIAECLKLGLRSEDEFIDWFERQKALLFGMTLERGTSEQSRDMYHLIRSLKPHPDLCKPDAHYYLPEFLGFPLYKKFHRYHLC